MIYNKKASTAVLDDLHDKVATALGKDLEDPKILALAIKFLKDNDITATPLESNEVVSLTDSIKRIASKDNKFEDISVEDMLDIAKE